ncbi:MAG: hypothetical protein IV100_16035 [Myxococcales bacterium]|nr:hypothetical protein [Myxococcales bacterium]
MFANTPSYLYGRFTREHFVRQASREPELAIVALEGLQAKPGEPTMTDLAHAYALLVALLDAGHTVPDWAQQLKWYAELADMARQTTASATILVNLPVQPSGMGQVFKVGEAA